MGKNPFAADAGARVFAEEGNGFVLVGARAGDRHEGIDAARREHDDAGIAEALGDQRGHVSVLDPREAGSAVGAEFLAGEIKHIGDGR